MIEQKFWDNEIGNSMQTLNSINNTKVKLLVYSKYYNDWNSDIKVSNQILFFN